MTLEKAKEWVKSQKVFVNTNEADAKLMVMQALDEVEKYRAIEKRLEEMFSGKLPLEYYVDSLEQQLLEPGSDHPMNARILTHADSAEWDAYLAAKAEIEAKSGKTLDVVKLIHCFLDTVFEGEKHEGFCMLTNEDAKLWEQYQAIGLSPELIEAMQGHNIALINQVEEIRMKTIEECINDIRKYADSAYDWNMDDKTDDGNVGYIEEGLYEAVERLQMLKSEESECSEEKNDDCIIKHLTRECSYNETGCSDCKGKERIKIALAKSEAKKPVDITRVKDGDNFVGYIGRCPHCGAIVDENDNFSYCDCGQKLAWSELY